MLYYALPNSVIATVMIAKPQDTKSKPIFLYY